MPAMKNVTFKADEKVIEAARERARAEHTTLNEKLRHWLVDYASRQQSLEDFDRLTNDLRGKVRIGRKLTRDEMNER